MQVRAGHGKTAPALSAFERNMADELQRTGTLRRTDGGWVAAFPGAPSVVAERLSRVVGDRYRGRADGSLCIVEFADFADLLSGTVACGGVAVPDDAFLDFSEVEEGTVAGDPESEALLHAVFSTLGRVVGGRPLPDSGVPDSVLSQFATDLPALERMARLAADRRGVRT